MTGQIAAIQTVLGVTVDGVWGPKSKLALDALVNPTPAATTTDTGYVVDERSRQNILTLLPPVQDKAVELLKLCKNAGLNIKIIGGTRTYAQQDELYEQGRSKPGRIVTKARGGASNHNFGIAFDIGVFSSTGSYQAESKDYMVAGALGKTIGLSWGGNWHFEDQPHFELKPPWANGMSENELLVELRSRHETNQTLFA